MDDDAGEEPIEYGAVDTWTVEDADGWARPWRVLGLVVGIAALVLALPALTERLTEPPIPIADIPAGDGTGFVVRLVDDDPLAGTLGSTLLSDGTETLWLKPRPLMAGPVVARAKAEVDGFGQPSIALELNREGARRFAELTQDHVGQRLAVILNGRLLTAPIVMSPITGGHLSITGGFTPQEAKMVAAELNAVAKKDRAR